MRYGHMHQVFHSLRALFIWYCHEGNHLRKSAPQSKRKQSSVTRSYKWKNNRQLSLFNQSVRGDTRKVTDRSCAESCSVLEWILESIMAWNGDKHKWLKTARERKRERESRWKWRRRRDKGNEGIKWSLPVFSKHYCSRESRRGGLSLRHAAPKDPVIH